MGHQSVANHLWGIIFKRINIIRWMMSQMQRHIIQSDTPKNRLQYIRNSCWCSSLQLSAQFPFFCWAAPHSDDTNIWGSHRSEVVLLWDETVYICMRNMCVCVCLVDVIWPIFRTSVCLVWWQTDFHHQTPHLNWPPTPRVLSASLSKTQCFQRRRRRRFCFLL